MPSFPLPSVDPLRVAAGLHRDDGTILLHTQRAWHGTGSSALLFDPVWALRAAGGTITAEGSAPRLERPANGMGARLEQLRGLAPRDDGPGLPLFAGYLGYESGSAALGIGRPSGAGPGLPDAWIGCYDAALVFGPSAPTRLCVRDLSGFGGPPPGPRAQALLDRIRSAERAIPPLAGRAGPATFPDPAWHAESVAAIQRHLRAGDVYQVNLTGFATAETDTDPFEHFLRHAQINPVAFAAYLRIDGRSITSHSPERLLRIRGVRAETAPIKGSMARRPGSDERLRASEKDRAEHLMIVDLCRNDLGRRAVTGSLRVDALMEPLEVRGIDHLVSRISAEVRPGGRGGLLDALFPGGSVTGAPKRRAMEIIAALETRPRGPYTGSIGYVTPDGDADFSIAIRTAVWRDDRVDFGCGGGIVIDSDPRAEYAEARLKAESFFHTLQAGP
jgi:anthranilate/para-aminobenzoate synthase component I